jgi:ATP-binding cassette, subfamily C, bacterial
MASSMLSTPRRLAEGLGGVGRLQPTGGALWPYIVTFVGLMRWRVALALALLLSLAVLETLGLLLLLPLLQLAGVEVQQGAVSGFADLVAQGFAAVGVQPTLTVVLGLYVALIIARALLNRWQQMDAVDLEQQFKARLRRRLYRAIANTSWPFFTRTRSADFSHALLIEMDRVSGIAAFLLGLLVNILVTAVYVAGALVISGPITFILLLCGFGLLVSLKHRVTASALSGEELSFATSGLHAAVTEHLDAMKLAKSYGVIDRNQALFANLTDRVAHIVVDGIRYHYDSRCWFEIGSAAALSIILVFWIEILKIPAGGVILLIFLFNRLMPRFSSLQSFYQLLAQSLPAFQRVVALQARCEAAAEPPQANVERGRVLQERVALEGVWYSYETEAGRVVIRDINLVIPVGETTAIVGPSGAGKSTLADLIMGLLAPDRGRVLVDGRPLAAGRLQAWRQQIGYVPQDTFLFHDTVRANLLWAQPSASELEVQDALRLADAEELVARLDHGLDTLVGDRGVRLSGGERQRLALARALLRRPSVLILDEATSNLDSESEARIQAAIERLHGQMTIVIITHRLSTVRRADTICVIEQGELVESGTWEQLYSNQQGRFHALCQAQALA